MLDNVDADLPAAYESLQVGIAVYDPEGCTVVDANDGLESLFGYATADLRQMDVDEYSANTYSFSAEDIVDDIRAAAAGSPRQFRWRVKRADGELVWVRFHLSPLELDGQTFVLAEVHDVSDYYAANRRVRLFSRILRHNLRNEGTVIAGRADRIAAVTDRPEVRETATTIRETAMDLAAITDSVEEIERAVTPTDSTYECRNATAAVREVVEEARSSHPDAELTVVERERMWIRIDEAFEHALAHAVDNAVRHAEDPTPRVEITVGPSPNTGRVEIRVVDDNPPIPDVEKGALDEFTETTDTSHGTGVGLFVMKWCIESLGGELAFERRDGGGNVVAFYLPPKNPPERR